jgi:hypothetical protein
MRSHSFRDRFVLWLKPAFCLWTAAASASSLKARFIARPHRNGFAVGGMARGAAATGQKEMLMPIEGKKAKETPAKKSASKPQRKSA